MGDMFFEVIRIAQIFVSRDTGEELTAMNDNITHRLESSDIFPVIKMIRILNIT